MAGMLGPEIESASNLHLPQIEWIERIVQATRTGWTATVLSVAITHVLHSELELDATKVMSGDGG